VGDFVLLSANSFRWRISFGLINSRTIGEGRKMDSFAAIPLKAPALQPCKTYSIAVV